MKLSVELPEAAHISMDRVMAVYLFYLERCRDVPDQTPSETALELTRIFFAWKETVYVRDPV